MSESRKWGILLAVVLLILVVSVSSVSATRYDLQGMVFIDDNLNGVWDVGEQGYGGELQWVEDEEVFRYVGAEVTITTPAYDEFVLETAGYRDFEEDEDIVCTQQDALDAEGELNDNPVRPCSGTFGLPVSVKDVFMVISVSAPEGYYVTSANPQYCYTGEKHFMDFGIAPIEGGGGGAPTVAAAAEVEETAAEVTEAPFKMEVKGTGFVPGLIFIDANEDGVWQPGEVGYGGEWMWVEDDEMFKYVGATITLVPPNYEEIELTSAGYVEPEDPDDLACTPQDYVIDNEINPNPVRPCSGTWSLTHAGNDIRWEVWVTAPEGYFITSANPQYYVTGSGAMPLDFGITPLAD